MEFHQRVRAARKAKGLTQQDVAGHFKIARVSVTQWEGGTSRPDPDKLADLADLFGVSLDWLLNERGVAPAPTAQRSLPNQRTFVRSRAFKFYVTEWREFMGVKVGDAAKAAGMPEDEYGAFEAYPINFTLGQIGALANEFGIRGDQFWFPPPKTKPAPLVPAAQQKQGGGGNDESLPQRSIQMGGDRSRRFRRIALSQRDKHRNKAFLDGVWFGVGDLIR